MLPGRGRNDLPYTPTVVDTRPAVPVSYGDDDEESGVLTLVKDSRGTVTTTCQGEH
jgi:hypothetical protein